MTERRQSHDPSGQNVTARLSLRPSESLKEIVAPFYRPSLAGQRLSRVALRSSIGVPLEVLPAQRYVYRDREVPGRNAIRTYDAYRLQHVRPIVGHQLPQLASLGILRSKDGRALRLQFGFGLSPDERQHLSQLHEFKSVGETGILAAQLDISPTELVPNEAVLHDAVHSLRSALGIHHPARQGQAPNQQYVGDMYSAAIESEGLSFRMSGS